MSKFQAFTFSYHQITIKLIFVSHKKFDAVPQLTGGQKPSKRLH